MIATFPLLFTADVIFDIKNRGDGDIKKSISNQKS